VVIIYNVTITRNAILNIVGSCSRFANFEIKLEEWKEVFGILIGALEGAEIHILSAIPLEHDFDKENSMRISDELSYIDTISKSINKNEIVGWFSSRYLGNNKDKIEIKNEDYKFHKKFKNIFPNSIFLLFNQLRIEYILKKVMVSDQIFGFNMFDVKDSELIEISWKCHDDALLIRVLIDELMLRVAELLPRYNLKENYKDLIKKNWSNLLMQFENFKTFCINKNNKGDLQITKLMKSSQSMDLKNLCKSIKKDIDQRLDMLELVEFKEKELANDLKNELIDLCIRVDDLQSSLEDYL